MTDISSTDSSNDMFMRDCVPRLHELSNNLWWSWTPKSRHLFEALDQTLWRLTHHNPVKQLQEIKQARLHHLAEDVVFRRRYVEAFKAFDEYLATNEHWFGTNYPMHAKAPIAYFSAEFGLHNSVPIYSGGLGILAGDHLKEASDLGVPLVGVSFMYRQSYFRQVIGLDGWQVAKYENLNQQDLPVQPALTASGTQCRIAVELSHRSVTCVVWKVFVGRTCLYLLDTDVPENTPDDRQLSARLYGGDKPVRLAQEMILGMGGVKALRALGIHPQAWHANEGHAAFLHVERLQEYVQQGMAIPRAIEAIRQNSVFTTHTPVEAGHDFFSHQLIEEYFAGFWKQCGFSKQAFLEFGKHPNDSVEHFHMTALGIYFSSLVNGVSAEHGRVSRRMWQCLWPDLQERDVPIQHVTNGVHVPTWIASEMNHLYSKYLGPDWMSESDNSAMWQRILEVPDHEIWEVRQVLKRKLLNFIRHRIRSGWVSGRLHAEQVLPGGTFLDPYVLTIGFGRRFATYKRANLLFRDLDRLRAILKDRWRPVQFIFAGKAHPADEPGKQLIHEVYRYAQSREMGGRIAFLEDYDMHVAKFLVQGVDVWLNNPRAPFEASGTSGQKAALNGVPNLSVLDGWWKEGYDGSNGWAFPTTSKPLDEQAQDDHDANVLYTVLEEEVIPLYYQCDQDRVPHGWVTIVKNAIRTNAPQFSARRMLKEYVDKFYIPLVRAESQSSDSSEPIESAG
ncbi:MAG: alpha-1,4 glucan phosphorylase [Nitrospirales bacterium]|nr:MAG: alpha-1,4 glucan phosphorylase [Nitrospirales bacterium]